MPNNHPTNHPINHQWLLRARPKGMVQASDFELHEASVPVPSEGEALVRVLYLSFDPAMRGWMEDRPSYLPPVGLGEVMRASAIGQVIESKNPKLKAGDFVQGMFGWQEYALTTKSGLGAAQVLPQGIPLTWPLSVCGGTGLTAYFGLLDLGKPVSGETVVISGAAGATGSVAGQIAKIHGCRVIGIAGGAEKCRWLTQQAHFDAAIDYKSENVAQRLRELCPKGLNVYFDNVGGEILEAALANLAQRARVVLCGGISGYNESNPAPGPRNLMNLVVTRSRMEGFIVIDYLPRSGEAVAQLAQWTSQGKITNAEDIQQGIENVPKTFLRLFEGKNVGKQLLKLAEPPLAARSA